MHHSSHHDHDHDHSHESTLYHELLCHFPYAIFSVAFGLSLLSIISIIPFASGQYEVASDLLFHCFHFIHLVFAATGTIVTFLRFSSNKTRALIVGIISPIVFCTLSDVIIPYIAGQLLGVHMHLHFCFLTELYNVLPFLIGGILNGFALSADHQYKQGLYSVFSHTAHIMVSSLASLFYLVSHGFANWHESIGMVFVFLVLAVVIPCTLSDVVVPMVVAQSDRHR